MDLILKALYESYKEETALLHEVIKKADIEVPLQYNQEIKVTRLVLDGLIIRENLYSGLYIRLTKKGMAFCIETSYAYPGLPIITYGDVL